MIQWALTSNSVLFKQTSSDFQWFYDGLKPYVNYIPIRPEFINVEDRYIKSKWAREHDQFAQQITKNA